MDDAPASGWANAYHNSRSGAGAKACSRLCESPRLSVSIAGANVSYSPVGAASVVANRTGPGLQNPGWGGPDQGR